MSDQPHEQMIGKRYSNVTGIYFSDDPEFETTCFTLDEAQQEIGKDLALHLSFEGRELKIPAKVTGMHVVLHSDQTPATNPKGEGLAVVVIELERTPILEDGRKLDREWQLTKDLYAAFQQLPRVKNG